jgi:hypothetical protein
MDRQQDPERIKSTATGEEGDQQRRDREERGGQQVVASREAAVKNAAVSRVGADKASLGQRGGI